MARLLLPLRDRNFRLLWVGSTISLLGDGFYYVAIAWQTLALSNAATALSLVWLAFTLPHLLALLFGGVLSDRLPRRVVLLVANVVSGAALGAVGLLSLAGVLRLWELFVLVAVYGAAEAVFGPAYGAIVPDVVDRDLLAQANALNQLNRPLALRLVGPALGGVLVGTLGAGTALSLDAATFAVSAVCVARLRPRLRPAGDAPAGGVRMLAEIRQGFGAVAQASWLWAGMAAYAVGTVVTWGCVQTLLPPLVKNGLGGGAQMLGAILAAGGVGSIVTALAVGRRDAPRRPVTVLFCALAGKSAAVALFGVAHGVSVALVASLFVGGFTTLGLIVWNTLLQQRVRSELLGRVNSIDWLVSTSLMPVALVAIGPIAGLVGVRSLLVVAGAGGALLTLGFLFVPGVARTDWESLPAPAPTP